MYLGKYSEELGKYVYSEEFATSWYLLMGDLQDRAQKKRRQTFDFDSRKKRLAIALAKRSQPKIYDTDGTVYFKTCNMSEDRRLSEGWDKTLYLQKWWDGTRIWSFCAWGSSPSPYVYASTATRGAYL